MDVDARCESSSVDRGQPRLRKVDRQQITWRPWALDGLLPEDHAARAVWAYVEGLDLSPLYAGIKSVAGHAGRDAIDPKIMLALWLYATIDGVGSARRLARLCEQHLAYVWLCGGVSVNHHTLSDFRVQQVEFLDRLLTQSVATLLQQGLVELNRVAQDGMRVRASAGSSSFRRREKLEQCLAEAAAQLAQLRQEAEQATDAEDRRVAAARRRASEERAARVRAALQQREELAEKLERREKGSGEKARASKTDPEARIMKMADGGFRPAYNVQFATTTDTRVIVGVDVVNAGTDGGQLGPMIEQLRERYGQRPRQYLADGGFSKLDDIKRMEAHEIEVYLPIMELDKKRARGIDPYAPQKGDSPEVARWRQRMGTPEAQAIYPQRAASAEFANAGCRNRGLLQFVVRGLNKVRAVALWQALAHNFQRTLALLPPPRQATA